MKQKTFGKWIAAAAVIGLVAIAVPVFACGYGYGNGYGMGYGNGYRMGYGGYGMMGYGAGYGMAPAMAGQTLTDAQQKQVNAIQSKYQPQLNELQHKISAKYSELASARANDHTTVAQLKTLRGSLIQLQNKYRTVLGQANSEIAQISGVGTSAYIPCALNGGNYGPGYMGGMMYGGYGY